MNTSRCLVQLLLLMKDALCTEVLVNLASEDTGEANSSGQHVDVTPSPMLSSSISLASLSPSLRCVSRPQPQQTFQHAVACCMQTKPWPKEA